MNSNYKAFRKELQNSVYTDEQRSKLVNQKRFKTIIANGSFTFKLSILNDLLIGKTFTHAEIAYNLLKFNPIALDKVHNLNTCTDSKEIKSYIGDVRLTKYFGIEPTLEAICTYFKIDLSAIESEEQRLIDEEVNKQRNEELKALEFKADFAKTEVSYLNISQLLTDKPFKTNFIKYINTDCSIISIYQALGKTKKFANEAIQAHKLLEHRAYIDTFKNLQDTPLTELVRLSRLPLTLEMFGGSVDIKAFAKYLNIKITKKQYTDEINLDVKAAALLKKYGHYGQSSIHNMYITDILNISKTELDKWKSDGRLVPTDSKSFYKWGKQLESDYFSPRYLASITPETVLLWRETDKLLKSNIAVDKLGKVASLTLALKDLNIFYTTKWYKGLDISLGDYTIKSLIEFDVPFELDELATKRNAKALVLEASNIVDLEKHTKKLMREIHKYALDDKQETYLQQRLSLSYAKLSYSDLKVSTFNSLCVEILKEILDSRQLEHAIQMTQIQDFEQSFSLARKLKRQIRLVVGPTNSGKTYEALQALKKAKSGIYLAPLRLLAMEIYDRLNADGVTCNLITGEEQIIIPGAKHTASTIEMANYQEHVEVAVIDEFQMLGDKERGWAWTSAMIGIPASVVYVLGNHQGLKVSEKLFEYLGEDVNVTTKQRLSPLELDDKMPHVNHLKKGDAIIAFSRRDVLSYATLCKRKGLKVSIIYGALSPEVRRTQAELFNSGVHDIIVSTDAIGMGLNLPINRIVFATLNKYDGTEVRTLNDTEILQIAGRAGRYNINDNGYVTLLENNVNNKNTYRVLKSALEKPFLSDLNVFSIAPHSWHLEALAGILKTEKLDVLLSYFTTLRQESLLKCADLSNVSTIYLNLSSMLDKFPLAEKYKLACAPTDDTPEMLQYYRSLLVSISKHKASLFTVPDYLYRDKSYRYLDEAEECSKQLSLYAWLSFHYDIFDRDCIKEEREFLSKYIAKALIKNNSTNFSKMIEPDVYKDRMYEDDYMS